MIPERVNIRIAPGSNLSIVNPLERRAAVLAAIRSYFASEGVIEVTTPVLRPDTVTDPHLKSIEVPGYGYLQTSPEYAMKILLAEFQCSMYQVCPAFRAGEVGNRHRQEFQMLEWYRCGFALENLMDDVARLIAATGDAVGLALKPPVRLSYRSLFEKNYSVNPHKADRASLLALCHEQGASHIDASSTDADCLDTLFSGIEPSLEGTMIVHGFPACQAALAVVRVNDEGDEVCERFEVYVDGIELANAYLELNDSKALRARFIDNNRQRARLRLPEIPLDEAFLDVADKVPPCAGIALGIDRLLMVLSGADNIEGV